MKTLKPDEYIRLKNLLVLHGRQGRFGAPTSKSLIEYLTNKGVVVPNNSLTSVYQGADPITSRFAAQIEKAFGLPLGWLSTDHEYLYGLDPEAIKRHALLSTLPASIQEKLYSLIEVLANEHRT